MAKIKKSKIEAQQLAIRLSKQGNFRTYQEAFNFAESVLDELRQSFSKKADNRIEQYKNAWTTASNNFVSLDKGEGKRARGNEQFRVWLEALDKEPEKIKNHEELKDKKGIAQRNVGYKGPASRVDLKKGTVSAKNIDTTDMQRVRNLRAQQVQREATTNITAGLDPSKAPKNLQTAPTQTYPSTTQTPSSAPSRQGEMLRRADLTNPAGVAEANYERELMDVARKEGKKGLQKKLEADTGVKHSKKSIGAIWKEFQKAIKYGQGLGGVPIGGGPSKGGGTPTKNLTGGKLGINDFIKLL